MFAPCDAALRQALAALGNSGADLSHQLRLWVL
jgi:hypothetical protein